MRCKEMEGVIGEADETEVRRGRERRGEQWEREGEV